MRRVGHLVTVLFVFATMATCAGASARDTAVRVYVNNRKVKLNPPAITRNGKAYVAIRGMAKAVHACAKWDAKTKTAIVTVGNKRKRVKQSDGIMSNGALFLPLRLTGEAVGCTVEWDRSGRCVRVTTEAPCPIGGG